MKKIITPAEAGREMEYNMWINGRMPMVHITATFDITRLVRRSRKDKHLKMNILMNYCIMRAAQQVKEMHLHISGKDFIWSDSVALQTIFKDSKGQIRFVTLPCTDSLEQFADAYYRMAKVVWETCEHHIDPEGVCVGTSCVSTTLVLDSIQNQYAENFTNPFLMWGAYKRTFPWHYKLPISLQFHHVQMNGDHATRFYEILQEEMKKV